MFLKTCQTERIHFT